MRTHKDLDVWKLAMDVIVDVYRIVKSFPKYEKFGLASQICRSAVSIASNIAEGAARHSKKEFVQFLYCALGSSAELETQLDVTERLEYIPKDELSTVIEKQVRVSKMISGLIKSIRRSSIDQ